MLGGTWPHRWTKHDKNTAVGYMTLLKNDEDGDPMSKFTGDLADLPSEWSPATCLTFLRLCGVSGNIVAIFEEKHPMAPLDGVATLG